MNEDKRMAGDYEIIASFRVGSREVVIGENLNSASHEKKYMTAYCESDELFERYIEVAVSDDYLKVVALFGERIQKQAQKIRDIDIPESIDNTPIDADGCNVVTDDEDINGKVIVIKPESLRREYRAAIHQLYLCKGGFGASANSRGSAVYCSELFSGTTSRFERYDVLGTIEPTKLPKWALSGLIKIQKDAKRREEAR